MTLERLSKVLNKLKKEEMLDLARKYNNSFDKIPNINKLKKDELKIELLSRHKKVYKVWSGDDKPTEKKKRKVPKLDKSEQEKLLKKSIELSEQAMNTTDVLERTKLLNDVSKIDKKLKKGL